MRRGLLALLLLLASGVWTGGIRLSGGSSESNTTDTLKVWVIGDTHWGSPIGDAVLGRNRIRAMIDESNARGIDAWIIAGDWQYGGSVTQELRDSMMAEVRSLDANLYPVIGNWEWSAADTGTGHLYDNFAEEFPGFFSSYVSTGDRGRRWYGERVRTLTGARTNVHVVAVQNNRQTLAGDGYYVNNPKDGSGVALDDFDGISDSTSAQRRDASGYARANVEWCDWVILAQHRATLEAANATVGAPSNRLAQEGWDTDADSSQVLHLESIVTPKRIILVEADQHENKVIGQYRKHYTLSACVRPRAVISDELDVWRSRATMWAYSDTAYSANMWADVVDSLGHDSSRIDYDGNTSTGYNGWHLFHELNFVGRSCLVRTYLIKQNGDVSVVDYTTWTL